MAVAKASSTADQVGKVIPIAAVEADGGETVVSLYEASKKIYPRSVSGYYARWRWVLVWFTQIIFYGLPWLQWGERQAVLFDLGARRFYLFGLVLYPQDFIYLTGLLVISALSLFLFTAVAGRQWCGYACPQTVYTEIFLWIERKIEGDRSARLRLDAGAWNLNKVLRKGGKHLVWLALALWTGFTFVGYFTPVRELWAESFTFGFGPWEWFWVNFYALATYGNAGFMREQVCKYMCPYARFQSAMFDKDTLIVSYDEKRGESRGARSRQADARALKAQGLGDCIDCTMCVQVCPTGIDIRKGLQYECISCGACVDVCDNVMDKMGYARGLIRYTTQNALQGGWSRLQTWKRVFRPRVLVYTAILWAIIFGLLASLALRSSFKVDVVRDRGVLARIVVGPDGRGLIENVYRLQIMNASENTQRFRIAVTGLQGLAVVSDGAEGGEVTVGPAQARWLAVRAQLPYEEGERMGTGSHPMRFEISADGQVVREKSVFLVPR
ncbi:cytochrome c oxidase accessory protein CcoG [Hylemonella gracilis]|uniref:4Fe-4S ferredoxin n=1 Tax=Hylemonella gracilis ATCC 19624 TaxID=887062 RepID=F3KPD8_9BURK|nr:4Fe-4S ferredoxin [Hylemonella gracilis ATCC 19624]